MVDSGTKRLTSQVGSPPRCVSCVSLPLELFNLFTSEKLQPHSSVRTFVLKVGLTPRLDVGRGMAPPRYAPYTPRKHSFSRAAAGSAPRHQLVGAQSRGLAGPAASLQSFPCPAGTRVTAPIPSLAGSRDPSGFAVDSAVRAFHRLPSKVLKALASDGNISCATALRAFPVDEFRSLLNSNTYLCSARGLLMCLYADQFDEPLFLQHLLAYGPDPAELTLHSSVGAVALRSTRTGATPSDSLRLLASLSSQNAPIEAILDGIADKRAGTAVAAGTAATYALHLGSQSSSCRSGHHPESVCVGE